MTMEINGIDLEKVRLIGTVLSADAVSRKVGVYIPRLMLALDGEKAKAYSVATNAGIPVSSFTNFLSSVVTKTNYAYARSWDKDEPMPDVGSKVEVIFLDGDMKQMYWRKFNPNGDYAVIPSEQYPAQCSLSFANSATSASSAIAKDDVLRIQLPDSFVITETDSGKTHSFVISDSPTVKDDQTSVIRSLSAQVALLSRRAILSDADAFNAIDVSSVHPDASGSPATVQGSLASYIASLKKGTYETLLKTTDITAADERRKLETLRISELLASYSVYATKKTDYSSSSETAKTALSAAGVSSASIESDYSSLLSVITNAPDYDTLSSMKANDLTAYSNAFAVTYHFSYYDAASESVVPYVFSSSSAEYAAVPAIPSGSSDFTGKLASIAYLEDYSKLAVIRWAQKGAAINDAYLWRNIDYYPVMVGIHIPIGKVALAPDGKVQYAYLSVTNQTEDAYVLLRTVDSAASPIEWAAFDGSSASLVDDLNSSSQTIAYCLGKMDSVSGVTTVISDTIASLPDIRARILK